MPKNAEKYECKKCNFSCSKKSNYEKHIATDKHRRITMNLQKMPDDNMQYECEICGKIYKYRSGLSKHKKFCNETIFSNKSMTNINQNFDSTDSTTKNLVIELLNQNKELQETLKSQQTNYQNQLSEIIPKIGNNTINNRFNLQVFLNEKCKDAINFTDFVDSLKIQLDDLENTRSQGLVHSISSLLIDNLNEMDMYKRPIHCTDSKRDTLYIKDAEKWEKDDEKGIIKNSINELANKQRKAMKAWTEAHPNWRNDEKLKDEYLQLLHEVMEPVEETEKEQNKIIKKLCSNTSIEKETTKELKEIKDSKE